MKRSLSILILSCLVLGAGAQTTDSVGTYFPKHHFGLNLGGGINTLLFKSTDGRYQISGGGLFQMNYQFYFHKNVGIGIGAGLSSLESRGTWTYTETTPGMIDSENGWEYTLISGFDELQETQDLLQLDIPLEFLIRAQIAPKWSMRIGVGASFMVPVWSQFRTTKGDFTTKGYYPRTNITYESTNGQDLSNHGFATSKANEKGSWTYKRWNAGVYGDLGFAVAASERMDVYFGLYAEYGFENYCSSNEGPMVEISGVKYNYHGAFNSFQVRHANPLEAGIKIGIAFHEKPRKKIDTSALDRLIEQATLMGNNSLCGIALTQAGQASQKSIRLRGSASIGVNQATTDVCTAFLNTAHSFEASADEYAKGVTSDAVRDSIAPYQDELAAAIRDAEQAAKQGDLDAAAKAAERAFAAAQAIETLAKQDKQLQVERMRADSVARVQADSIARVRADSVAEVERMQHLTDSLNQLVEQGNIEGLADAVERTLQLDTVNGRAYYKHNSTVAIYEGSALTALQVMAETLQKDPSLRLLVVGHTDNTGTHEVNMRYGLERAKNLKRKLVSLGAPASQIDVESRGETEPKYDNSTEEGQRLNRRAEIHVIRTNGN